MRKPSRQLMLRSMWVSKMSVMLVGGLVEVFLGIDAENKALEDVATPLSGATTRPRATG